MIVMHMNFSSLSNQDLHLKTIEASRIEKQATLTLLEYLHEVDCRRLHAERGYSSLWMYVHKELGYSEAQTSERVGAMRLMNKIPEVKQSIIENKLTLTSVAKLASFVRKEKIDEKKVVELLAQVEQKSSREVERVLLSEQKVPGAKPDLVKMSGLELSRISFDVDEEFMILLERMKELQSDPGLSLQEVFKKTMKEYIKKREIKMEKREKCLNVPQHTASRAPEVKSRFIPLAVKNQVRLRSQDQCEFVSHVQQAGIGAEKESFKLSVMEGRRCKARSQLQFDHRLPFAFGGSNGTDNIRHLCREHNIYEAERLFGHEKMKNLLGRRLEMSLGDPLEFIFDYSPGHDTFWRNAARLRSNSE